MHALKPSLQTQRGHAWLVLAPGADVLSLLFIFLLFFSQFLAPQGIEVSLPSSRFQLADFQNASQLWVPAKTDQLILNGQLISAQELPQSLAQLKQGSTEARLLIQADAQLSFTELSQIVELASQSGLIVALGAAQSPADSSSNP